MISHGISGNRKNFRSHYGFPGQASDQDQGCLHIGTDGWPEQYEKAALSVGEKSVSMLKSKDLLPLTGYVHGGCSPIGMKKQFKTVIDRTAGDFEEIVFSAGKIGFQVEITLEDLKKAVPITEAELTY